MFRKERKREKMSMFKLSNYTYLINVREHLNEVKGEFWEIEWHWFGRDKCHQVIIKLRCIQLLLKVIDKEKYNSGVKMNNGGVHKPKFRYFIISLPKGALFHYPNTKCSGISISLFLFRRPRISCRNQQNCVPCKITRLALKNRDNCKMYSSFYSHINYINVMPIYG